jgi:hypothetical protein
MRKKLQTVKAPKVIREHVDFETWKANLAGLLKHGSAELRAFQQWMTNHSEYFAQIGRPELTNANALLEVAFECTQPEISSKEELRRYEFAAKKVRELLPDIDTTIGALRSTRSYLIPKDGMGGRRFDSLRRSLEKAAGQIRWALIITDRPNVRSADIVDYCITFLASIFMCDVTERDALALTSLLMKAHGFSDEEGTVFGTGAVESGRFRKRVNAYKKANSDIKKTQEAFLALQRKRPSRNSEEVQTLSKKFAELMEDYDSKSK